MYLTRSEGYAAYIATQSELAEEVATQIGMELASDEEELGEDDETDENSEEEDEEEEGWFSFHRYRYLIFILYILSEPLQQTFNLFPKICRKL